MSLRCSICEREFQPEDSPALPFCSERCRMIDLGRWLKEGYGMPIESEEEREAPQMNTDPNG
jgi:uncharacterized protein